MTLFLEAPLMFFPAYLAQYFTRWLALKAVCLAMWAAMGPGARTPDAEEIAESIATAVLEDLVPVFRSQVEDAAVLAYYARAESDLRRAPTPHSWDALAGVSCGVWQQRCATLAPTILGQACAEVELMHRGAVLCPESPGAPTLGGCHGLARRIADRRLERARALLEAMQ